MANIGEPQRIHEITPLEEPVPLPDKEIPFDPSTLPDPTYDPLEDPDYVPSRP